MTLVLILQLLTLWPVCHTDITLNGTQEAQRPRTHIYSVPPTLYPKFRPLKPRPLILVPPTLHPKSKPRIYSVSPNSYIKPLLEAQPATVVTPGINVTLMCRAPQPTWRFALFKSGEITPVLYRDVSTELAEFFLEEVTEAQGGSYRCCYRNPWWAPGVWSHLSDALELLVTDLLPRPSLVVLPGPVLATGDTVNLRCAGRLRNMNYALYRAGEEAPLQYQESVEPWADFSLPGARARGTYSCYYHTPVAPYVLSQSSEPLVITSDGSAGFSSMNYTRGNFIRLGLAGLVLISMAMLVVWDWRSWRPVPSSF